MKFTLSWLKDHLETTASLEEISTTLTAIGLEVESITDRSEELAPFTVAKILEAEKHPEANKLQICKVESDAGELKIVCGAPNARAGLYVVLAKEGTTIPANGMVIKKTKIRGVESNGMLCSFDELGIEGDSSGIIELPQADIGSSVAALLGQNDPVIEIAITPNRADCLGVRGIARDLAAAKLGTLKPLPNTAMITGGENSSVSVSISSAHCQQFIGCLIKGVKNTPSPAWMKQRLEAIGLRPISSLVDITNYITFDLGRPLHVYDADKLKGNLVVRDAVGGEPLAALDDKHYELEEGMCVIADDSGALGLGGIIGGTSTGCDETTTNVFLEVALFEPIHVAGNGRKLQIESDARYRFERGIDVAFLEEGAKQALRLIKELCGGTASDLVMAGSTPDYKRTIKLRNKRATELGGVDIPSQKIADILKNLGFECEAETNGWQVVPPSWRADVEGEADLVEEVLRIHGYEHIPPTPLPKLATIGKPVINLSQKRVHLTKRLLAARGFMESCSWSFTSAKQAAMFGGNNEALTLLNPISADLDTMRPSLLPNLLEAAKKNAARGFSNQQLCEVGLQFSDVTPQGQHTVAAGIHLGTHRNYVHGEQFQEQTPPLDVFDAKTEAMHVLSSLGVNKFNITTDTPTWYHPGRSGALTLGGKIILGYFGEIHPGLLPHYDLDAPVAGFEIFLDAIPTPRAKSKAKAKLQLSDYQATERDFAFIVDEKVAASDIIKAVSNADKKLITDVEIFDVYAGKNVDDGKKSVAVRVRLQSFERTLSDDDIGTVSKAVVAAADKAFGGVLRQ
ncbi:MAG: phenylalanine--tRNA ligase subunit beta [Rickettsiales bacterium]